MRIGRRWGGFLSQGFPPAAMEWTNYNAEVNGAFHDWFLEYHDSLMLGHPNHYVRMIPTGPIISNLLQEPPFDQIAVDTLYEDDAPHGRPSVYFLVVMITYMAMYEEQPPVSYQPTAFIDPIIANNYQQASDFIWNELMAFNDMQGNSRVFCQGSTTSIPENDLLNVQVYPDPARTNLTLLLDEKIVSVQIFDVKGQLCSECSDSNTIEVQSLQNGMYTILVNTPKGVARSRFVKE